jgi:hypothetical protein
MADFATEKSRDLLVVCIAGSVSRKTIFDPLHHLGFIEAIGFNGIE